MTPRDMVLAQLAAMSDRQLEVYLVATVGLFAAVAAGRGRHDIEWACVDFVEAMHRVTGYTPPPPTPKAPRP